MLARVSGAAGAPLRHPAVPSPAETDRASEAGERERLRHASSSPTLRAAAIAAVSARPLSDPLSFAGLAACIEEAQAAALVPADGPPDPATFAALRARVAAASARLPAAYGSAVGEPLLRVLDELGPRGFARLLAEDPDREGAAGLLLDAAQAVLQHGEGYQRRATAAFQEVVSDLYDGFLSAEDRRGVDPPDHGVAAPLVRWGSAEAGPYTWPASVTAELGLGAALVSLPAANASAGLLAWPALAHETAGHDVLAADEGLQDELAGAVRGRLLDAGMGPEIADYWADRIDETASDVLGVLNMGPAAAVGLLGYFRALNGAWSGNPSLRSVGPSEDPHPADLARAYLAAETVRLLAFEGASRWADALVAEADRDLARIRLGDVGVTAALAKESAALIARTIVRTPVAALEGRALGDIQDWRDADEAIVAALRQGLAGGDPRAGKYVAGAYAAHAVAAGVYEAVGGTSTPAQAMGGMIDLLSEMHGRNERWRKPIARAAPAAAR